MMNLKSYLLSMLCAMVTMSVSAYNRDPDYRKARVNGAQSRIVLNVLDDDGAPVTNANVHVLMGMNYRLRSYDIDGVTDKKGRFIIEGKTTGNEIEISISRGGYYPAKKKLSFLTMGEEKKVKDGKWQPWGMELEIRMGKVRNPVPLVGFLDGISVPAIGTWVGFDMKEKDWVYAGHRGRTSDFEVNFRWDGKPFDLSELLEMNVRFTEKYSGYYLTKPSRSSFRGVYSASTNESYRQSLVCNIKERGSSARMGFEHPLRMVIRSRCIVDESGNLVSSNYSTIGALVIEGGWKTNGIVNLSYLFNPRPNDTNLEPKR